MVVDPRTIREPSRSVARWVCCPSTTMPLVDPRSSTIAGVPGRISACLRETPGSSIRMSASVERPSTHALPVIWCRVPLTSTQRRVFAPLWPAPGSRTRYWIEINGTRHQISRPTLVLGRSTEADVRIDDPGVSRRHCEIRTGTPSTIQDLGSTNGIVVDGQHTTRATLRDGSRIVVGSTTVIYRQAEG